MVGALSVLASLVKRVKRHDERLKEVESQMKKAACSGCSSSSAPGSTPKRSRKRDVPDEVRVSYGGERVMQCSNPAWSVLLPSTTWSVQCMYTVKSGV